MRAFSTYFCFSLLSLFLSSEEALSAQDDSNRGSPKFREVPAFADAKWGSTRPEVRKRIEAAGFVFQTEDKDGDLLFGGAVLGVDTDVLCFFANDQLVKVHVRLKTADSKAVSTYRDMVEVLTKKFGRPQIKLEDFRSPYYKGDGFEEQAIRSGKATFASGWGAEGSSGGVVIDIGEQLVVDITYESSQWGAEAQRRRAQATSAF
jgi:hypothetical protein